MPLPASAVDQVSELIDACRLPFDEIVDRFIRMAAHAREELNTQLLEIARKTCRQQTLPLVGGHKAGNLLLRPIQPKCLAEARVSARQRKFVDLLVRRESGNAEYAVQLVQAYETVNDVLACSKRDQPVAARRRFIADFGTDQLRRRCRDLADAGLEQLAKLRYARIARCRADDVGDVSAHG